MWSFSFSRLRDPGRSHDCRSIQTLEEGGEVRYSWPNSSKLSTVRGHLLAVSRRKLVGESIDAARLRAGIYDMRSYDVWDKGDRAGNIAGTINGGS